MIETADLDRYVAVLGRIREQKYASQEDVLALAEIAGDLLHLREQSESDVFTPAQVLDLHGYQFAPWPKEWGAKHPYTCPNRSDGKHFDNGSDLGALIPTTRGWICQCCNYRQTWAHDHRADRGTKMGFNSINSTPQASDAKLASDVASVHASAVVEGKSWERLAADLMDLPDMRIVPHWLLALAGGIGAGLKEQFLKGFEAGHAVGKGHRKERLDEFQEIGKACRVARQEAFRDACKIVRDLLIKARRVHAIEALNDAVIELRDAAPEPATVWASDGADGISSRRPQDPTLTGEGLKFETCEHGGDEPDCMPQAVVVTDAEGRKAVYVYKPDAL